MEFKKYKLNEVLTLNPTLKLKKNTIAKKIAMENIKEYQKKIDSYTYSEFKSGSKFMNGDTLLARITPCLENGKTAYVDILDENEIAFGSTEFFVLRPKDNLMDSHFLYYLMRTNELRNTIIKSMTGTSGRQRAQKESILEYEFCLPSLKAQTAIAKLLKNLDDKIETNKKIIANLEELSQTLFKRWFVDFEFPDENSNPYKSSGGEMIDSELGKIPLSWKVQKLNDIFKINYGKNLPTKKILNNGYPVFGGNGIIGYYSNYMYETPKILISCRGAASGKIHISKEKSFVTNNSIVLDEKQKNYFYYFKELYKYNDFKRYTTGSAQPQITIANIKYLVYLTPNTNIIDQFNSKVSCLFNQKNNCEDENQDLAELRDTLLPKLMSGEIEIPDDIQY